MIKTDGITFKDEHNRTLLLRGVNLGGGSKVPYPNGATYIREGFFEHQRGLVRGASLSAGRSRRAFPAAQSLGADLSAFPGDLGSR